MPPDTTVAMCPNRRAGDYGVGLPTVRWDAGEIPRCGAFPVGCRTKKCTGSQHSRADAGYPDLTGLAGRIDSGTGVYEENGSSANGGSDGPKLVETGLMMMTSSFLFSTYVNVSVSGSTQNLLSERTANALPFLHRGRNQRPGTCTTDRAMNSENPLSLVRSVWRNRSHLDDGL